MDAKNNSVGCVCKFPISHSSHPVPKTVIELPTKAPKPDACPTVSPEATAGIIVNVLFDALLNIVDVTVSCVATPFVIIGVPVIDTPVQGTLV
jgi:hypothetical protein